MLRGPVHAPPPQRAHLTRCASPPRLRCAPPRGARSQVGASDRATAPDSEFPQPGIPNFQHIMPFSAPSAPLVGRCVTLAHLHARPELNGTRGEAVSFACEKGRYIVESAVDHSKICVKPENLEFVHDGVSFAEDESKGRGVFACADIPAGELLVASRAFATTEDSAEALAQIIYGKLQEQSKAHASHRQLVDQLSGGPRYPAVAPFVAPFGHGAPTGDRELEPALCDLDRVRALYDLDRVRAIVSENCFACIPTSREWVGLLLKHGKRIVTNMGTRGRGVWILPSAFNHSCLNNATWETAGDMLFVYTVRQVRKGEEICLTYVQKELTFAGK